MSNILQALKRLWANIIGGNTMNQNPTTYTTSDIKEISPTMEKELGVDNLAYVIAVNFDGNLTLYKPARVSVHPITETKPVPAKQIVRIIEGGATVVFDQNPRCIRMSIGGQLLHIHVP